MDSRKKMRGGFTDALVVSIRVEDYDMHRVLVDIGSSTDILYYPAF